MICEPVSVSVQFNYALALENGKGSKIDLVTAAKYYKRAADSVIMV